MKSSTRKQRTEQAKRTEQAQTVSDLRIALVGFMGAGKTTVGRALAKHLACGFVDLDARITLETHVSPQTWIETEGEACFREIETATLARVTLDRNQIIALGGGAWTIESNRRLIVKRNYSSVWLDASFDLCWRRIERNARERPLARDKATARTLYEERRALYDLADLHIQITDSNLNLTLAQLIEALSKTPSAFQ